MPLARHGFSGTTPALGRGCRAMAVAILTLLAACTPAPQAQVGKSLTQGSGADPWLAPMATFAVADPAPVTQGTAELGQDFLDLSFGLESGRSLPVFSRFEAPITLALTGDVPPTAAPDLQRLLGRLRAEAGIDLAAPPQGSGAALTIAFHPRAHLQRLAPSAACFVVPNVSSLTEYQRLRGTSAVDWAEVRIRTRATIFIPSDASPQEVRDCLHEEMAQAIGPLNDLYRLSESVFNDDNFNSVLTGFDMAILRMTYAPELRSGMSRAEVAAALPGLAQRLGYSGTQASAASPTPRSWVQAIEAALGRGDPRGERLAAAERAVLIARAEGWTDSRAAFSLFAIGRLLLARDPARATRALTEARAIYARLPGAAIHAAHVDMQLAAIALASGRPDQAIAFADRAVPRIAEAQNAALLATMMLIKAEALEQVGLPLEARALRLDSQPFARYGFGSDAVMEARRRDIALLAARGQQG